MYARITVSGSGTEKQFLDAFTGRIVGSGAGITLTDDYTAKLSQDEATPGFTLHIGSALDLVFTRTAVSAAYATGYTVTTPQDGSISATLYWGNNLYSDERAVRTWGFDIAFNPDKSFTLLNLGGDIDLEDYPQRELSALVMRGAKSGYAMQANTYGQTPDPLISLPLSMSDNSSVTKCDRLPYVYDSTDFSKIHLIRSKMFLTTESTNRASDSPTLFDVSTVTSGSLLMFDGKKYYALDSHTIMEV